MLIKRCKKAISLLLIITMLLNTPVFSYAKTGCPASGSTFTTILTESISTLYNIFPIRIGGVPIQLMDLPDTDVLGGMPICICIFGTPPIPHIGLTFQWWNPQAVIETVKQPLCFPSLGLHISIGKFLGEGKSDADSHGGSEPSQAKKNQITFLSGHYIKYPTIALLNLLVDVMCLNFTESGIDIFYLTEIDPIWRNDTLSSIINPEAILFANPIAQTACIADAITSTTSFPLNPLFWCMGTWGSAYPLAGTKQGTMNKAAAGLAARMIYRMSRQLMLWKTIGRDALCQPVPMPIWIKSQYGIFEAYPKLWPKRFHIGYPESIWGANANPPVPGKDDNYVWFLYQHHDCCLF